MSGDEKPKLQHIYKRILEDHFPSQMMMIFSGTALDDALGAEKVIEPRILIYQKVFWDVVNDEGKKIGSGLRYGDNPGQEAAMYKLANGNLAFGNVKVVQPGKYLLSNVELLQLGKHPGKTNITDADNALNILRYFMDENVVAIMKHNNPCGVAIGTTLEEA